MNKWDIIAILGFLALLIVSFYVGTNDTQSAMKECQKKHSFDTCFTTINR